MTISYAFVTLITSDAYLPGALTVAAALKDVHLSLPLDQTVKYETVCLVTPETVDITTIRLLRKAFSVVVGVETIVPPDTEPLTLLGRADLDTALTKLHAFRLTQYSKVIFLDADVLPLRPLSHLFRIDHEFSAVPDVGWPDIFNSGVMVLSPGNDKFNELRNLLNTKGTWDGADQGLLNEWRGSNWNRLSFTYNTTPTAIYTYAPAYKRFGPQIAVVHFIGPHKPWHSIAHRASGSSAQSTGMAVESSTEIPATQQPAYDYGSLVDRWYNIYDPCCRSQAVEPVFQPSRYMSIWNERGHRPVIVAGRALGLEELRRAALEGMEALGMSSQAHGKGEYRTMPLDGRFDLIRPRTRAERKYEQVPKNDTETPESTPTPTALSAITPEPSTPPAQIRSLPSGSPVRRATLPTPGIREIPPAPQARLISLPSTPLRCISTPYKPPRKTREAGAQTAQVQTVRQEVRQAELSLACSMRSPATEALPGGVMPAPMDAFPKVWDNDRNRSSISFSSSETLLNTTETSPSERQPHPAAFFNPSNKPTTPEMPRHQSKYRSIVRGEKESPTPDPTKVQRVFPWENRPRCTPGRVFPDEASPAPLAAFPHFPISVTPVKKSAFCPLIPSPLAGFPPSFRFHYLPGVDGLFSQRRTERPPRPVPFSSLLGLESDLGRMETGSQDGDVEDEVDSEEETVMRSRSRSSSIGTAMRNSKYRSIGVQTEPRELREEGIQVTTPAPAVEVAEKPKLTNKRLRRVWLTSSGTSTPPTLALTHASASSPLSRPSTSSSRDRGTSATSAPVQVDDHPSSAPSTPLSSPDGGPHLSRIRKGSRVWDPARGVETFKQGSEEVLAKFMMTGSWEQRA